MFAVACYLASHRFEKSEIHRDPHDEDQLHGNEANHHFFGWNLYIETAIKIEISHDLPRRFPMKNLHFSWGFPQFALMTPETNPPNEISEHRPLIHQLGIVDLRRCQSIPNSLGIICPNVVL